MREPSIARGMRSNRHTLDEDSASRLLQGHVHPDDAPPGYSAVAGLLNSAAELPLSPVDEEAAAITVSAMVEVIRDATPAPEIPRRKTMLGKLLAGKALAAVAVFGLTATGAAAGTGVLPDPAQNVVSEAVSHVGIDIPRGKSEGHRKDGEHRKDKNNNPTDEAPADEAPADETPVDETPVDETTGDETTGEVKGMSGIVQDIKDARTPESGPMGQDVCKIASDGKCKSGDQHKGQGGDDETAPPSTEGQSNGQGDEKNGDNGKPAETPAKPEESPAKPEETPAKPKTPAGSIATGAQNSGRDVPSGRGKPE